MIDTSGTRYEFARWSPGVWALRPWQEFLDAVPLRQMDDFMRLRGEIVDRNRRSQVHRIQLGSPEKVFYLKVHKDYVRHSWKGLFKAVPMVAQELTRLMDYARAGLDALEPVAWGWRPRGMGGDSFLLTAELKGFRSLDSWLSDASVGEDRVKRRAIGKAVAGMLDRMHRSGLAHVDLFAWHVFLKPMGSTFQAQAIDLERSRIRSPWPGSSHRILKKQANDLAMLHLTVPWPQVSHSERMRFFLDYRGHNRLTLADKRFIRASMKVAKHRGRRSKFKRFGVAQQLRGGSGKGE
jgi:hypothetical protein